MGQSHSEYSVNSQCKLRLVCKDGHASLVALLNCFVFAVGTKFSYKIGCNLKLLPYLISFIKGEF